MWVSIFYFLQCIDKQQIKHWWYLFIIIFTLFEDQCKFYNEPTPISHYTSGNGSLNTTFCIISTDCIRPGKRIFWRDHKNDKNSCVHTLFEDRTEGGTTSTVYLHYTHVQHNAHQSVHAYLYCCIGVFDGQYSLSNINEN